MEVTAKKRKYSPRMPKEERREQLLDAALHLIATEGWSGVSVEAVAREAEIAKSVVYEAFGSRDGMFAALLEREQERAIGAVAEAIPTPPFDRPAPEVAGAAITRFLEAVARNPDTWTLILLPPEGTPATVRKVVERDRERFRKQLEPVAAWALAEFDAPGLDVELLTHLARGNAEYLAGLVLDDPKLYSPERLGGFVTEILAGVEPA
jgi:AcrR family transcriptional regulator